MQTIHANIRIPENRMLMLQLPPEIPSGQHDCLIVIDDTAKMEIPKKRIVSGLSENGGDESEDIWTKVKMFQFNLRKRKHYFSDSAELIREERDL